MRALALALACSGEVLVALRPARPGALEALWHRVAETGVPAAD